MNNWFHPESRNAEVLTTKAWIIFIPHALVSKCAAFLRVTVNMRGSHHHLVTTLREQDMTVQYNQQGNAPNSIHHYFIGTSMLLFIIVLLLYLAMEEYVHVLMVFQAVMEMLA